jgi:ATP/maltotriose-dependent transcriptional regulator MalT
MLHPLRATGRNNDVEGIVEEVLSKPQIPLIEAVARLERIETRVRDGRVADCVPELRRLRGDPRLDPGMRTVAGAALIGSQIRSGDTDGAATLAPVILEESRSQGNDYALGAALMAHALVSTWLGRVDQALQDASEAVEIDHRMRLVVAPHPALGIALLAGDRFADARRTFDQGRRREVEAGEVSSLALTVAGEAMVSFLAGEWEDAEAEAESALALTRDGGSHLQGIMAVYCVLGQIALRRGDLDTARRWVERLDQGSLP